MPDAAFQLRRSGDRLRARERCVPTCCASPTSEARRATPGSPRRAGALRRCRRSTGSAAPDGGGRARVLPRPVTRAATSPTSPACQHYLIAGESYEICLTNKSTPTSRPSRCRSTGPAALNPAPFAAYLRFGDELGRVLLAGALPQCRPRPLGRGQADQGHRPPRATPAEDAALARGAAHRREDPRREPDDHRPAAQRPRAWSATSAPCTCRT